MSALIWITIRMTKNFTVEVQIPVELIQSDSMSYIEKPVDFINYKISGRGWDLLAMRSQSQYYQDTFVYELDESSQITIPETRIYNFLEDKLSNLVIISTNPESFTIKQSRAHVKKIPLRVPLNINLEAGYALTEELLIKPDSVFIKGPENEINSISSWSTDSVNTAPLNSSTEMRIKVVQPATPVVSISPQYTSVKLSIERYTQKSLYIPIELKNAFKEDLSIFPSRIQLKFKVPISKFDLVEPKDFKAIVNFSQRIPETNKLIIQIAQKPAYIKEIGFNPQVVEYFYTEEVVENKE